MYCIVKLLENAHSWEHSPNRGVGLEHPRVGTPYSSFIYYEPSPIPTKTHLPFPVSSGYQRLYKV